MKGSFLQFHSFKDTIWVREVKLTNRRISVFRQSDGGIIVMTKRLNGWKDIVKLAVPLSAEATDALLTLLLESHRNNERLRISPGFAHYQPDQEA